jgi:glucans biosynthesis protein
MGGRLLTLATFAGLIALTLGAGSVEAKDATPFNHGVVKALARDLAKKPFQPPDTTLPPALAKMGYDEFRSIRFTPEHALWRGEGLPFEIQFFHRGFLFPNRIEINQVIQGRVEKIEYASRMFKMDNGSTPAAAMSLGFAGFRIHAPINRADYFDEVGAFLGASYFRAVAKRLGYGLSSRGLAINTGGEGGEEFPYFKEFWIEKPAAGATSMVVHALLDSSSVAGAYRFTIRPGEETLYDVELTLFPRRDLANLGIAPVTSMYLFDDGNRGLIRDYRVAVHDSDGMAIHTGDGVRVWRPLTNPRDVQISPFNYSNVRGFGLIQRQREFSGYQDLESRFDLRPSAWVEPIGNWGDGSVQLMEAPTKDEFADNVNVFWKPQNVVRAGSENSFTYRLHWAALPGSDQAIARVVRTSLGPGTGGSTLFVLDFEESTAGDPDAKIRGVVKADKAEVKNVVTQRNPITKGWRLSFELQATTNETTVELNGRLLAGEKPISELWTYRFVTEK